VALQFESFPQ